MRASVLVCKMHVSFQSTSSTNITSVNCLNECHEAKPGSSNLSDVSLCEPEKNIMEKQFEHEVLHLDFLCLQLWCNPTIG